MLINTLQTGARFISVAILFSLLSACTHYAKTKHTATYYKSPTHRSAQQIECMIHPASCFYSGPYEPDERDFAEQEAKRLNQESLHRLRRVRKQQ